MALLLPTDTIVATEFKADAQSKTVQSESIPDDWMGLDIGEKTVELFVSAIKDAKTVIWNGPMGVFEFANFSSGTKKIALAISKVSGTTIVGGGDTVSAVSNFKLENKISHISTGGGASLALLEGAELPGLEVISDK